jgi:hypothetical protein
LSEGEASAEGLRKLAAFSVLRRLQAAMAGHARELRVKNEKYKYQCEFKFENINTGVYLASFVTRHLRDVDGTLRFVKPS